MRRATCLLSPFEQSAGSVTPRIKSSSSSRAHTLSLADAFLAAALTMVLALVGGCCTAVQLVADERG